MIEALVARSGRLPDRPGIDVPDLEKAVEPSAVFTYYGILLLFHAILSAIGATFVVRMVPGYDLIQSGRSTPSIVSLAMLVGIFILTLIPPLDSFPGVHLRPAEGDHADRKSLPVRDPCCISGGFSLSILSLPCVRFTSWSLG